MVHVALTIAGSDPSGGAGIQADLKTFHQHGVYGESVVTLLTVQSTVRVSRVEPMSAALVREQLEAVIEDIPPDAAKTGALGTAEVVAAVAHAARGFRFPLVVDPVMISKHGAPLLSAEAAAVLKAELVPHATLLMPNAHEAAALTGREVRDLPEAREAARALLDLGCRAVLVKGGHIEGPAVDVLCTADGALELSAPRIETRHTHGTGCTYSAAITARLARGEPLEDAARAAKAWLTRAIEGAPGLGRGHGPVSHLTEEDEGSR